MTIEVIPDNTRLHLRHLRDLSTTSSAELEMERYFRRLNEQFCTLPQLETEIAFIINMASLTIIIWIRQQRNYVVNTILNYAKYNRHRFEHIDKLNMNGRPRSLCSQHYFIPCIFCPQCWVASCVRLSTFVRIFSVYNLHFKGQNFE